MIKRSTLESSDPLVSLNDGVLMVGQRGVFIGKRSERLRVSNKGDTVLEAPLMNLRQVLVTAQGVSLSSDAVQECAQRGVDIAFVSQREGPYACLVSPNLSATIRTRREQLLAFGDGRGVHLSLAWAEGKVQNQANVIKYAAKYRKATQPGVYEQAREMVLDLEQFVLDIRGLRAINVDGLRGALLNLEGRAAQRYWQAFKLLMAGGSTWPGREHQGAQDAPNCMLNFGYALLESQVQGALLRAGLDVYGGYIHVDRPGKASLVLDLMEEFRAPVVDRVVLSILNRGMEAEVAEGRLTDGSKRLLVDKVFERLDSQERYEGQQQRLRNIIQAQARRIATFVRGEQEYRPWISRW